jgi:hypothetical protein
MKDIFRVIEVQQYVLRHFPGQRDVHQKKLTVVLGGELDGIAPF